MESEHFSIELARLRGELGALRLAITAIIEQDHDWQRTHDRLASMQEAVLAARIEEPSVDGQVAHGATIEVLSEITSTIASTRLRR